MSRLATLSYICALEISSNLISVVQRANFPVSYQNQETNFSFFHLKGSEPDKYHTWQTFKMFFLRFLFGNTQCKAFAWQPRNGVEEEASQRFPPPPNTYRHTFKLPYHVWTVQNPDNKYKTNFEFKAWLSQIIYSSKNDHPRAVPGSQGSIWHAPAGTKGTLISSLPALHTQIKIVLLSQEPQLLSL